MIFETELKVVVVVVLLIFLNNSTNNIKDFRVYYVPLNVLIKGSSRISRENPLRNKHGLGLVLVSLGSIPYRLFTQ